jgi:CheY-like chemotaxis protein
LKEAVVSACILVVDDNPVNLKLVCDVLQCEGFTVAKAVDAEQALQMLGGLAPDLILMDLALPGMDGLSLTRQLKADARFSRVPIVALTAFAMKGDAEKAIAAGCDAYITKPIDTRSFPLQIAQFLPGSTAHRPAEP